MIGKDSKGGKEHEPICPLDNKQSHVIVLRTPLWQLGREQIRQEEKKEQTRFPAPSVVYNPAATAAPESF